MKTIKLIGAALLIALLLVVAIAGLALHSPPACRDNPPFFLAGTIYDCKAR